MKSRKYLAAADDSKSGEDGAGWGWPCALECGECQGQVTPTPRHQAVGQYFDRL